MSILVGIAFHVIALTVKRTPGCQPTTIVQRSVTTKPIGFVSNVSPYVCFGGYRLLWDGLDAERKAMLPVYNNSVNIYDRSIISVLSDSPYVYLRRYRLHVIVMTVKKSHAASLQPQ